MTDVSVRTNAGVDRVQSVGSRQSQEWQALSVKPQQSEIFCQETTAQPQRRVRQQLAQQPSLTAPPLSSAAAEPGA